MGRKKLSEIEKAQALTKIKLVMCTLCKTPFETDFVSTFISPKPILFRNKSFVSETTFETKSVSKTVTINR